MNFYPLKRIFAYCIDLGIVMVVGGLLVQNLMRLSASQGEMGAMGLMAIPYLSMAIHYGTPVLLLGTLSGLFGWTPGKLLFGLRVKNRGGGVPGVGQGMLREIVKALALGFMFLGALWALYGIITSQCAFYDDWIGLEVDDLRPTGLTDTQRKWREYQKKSAR